MKPTDVVAVSDETGTAGCVTLWRLSGPTDPDTLAAAWSADPLLADMALPVLPAPPTALSRAVKVLQRGRTLVRPLENHGGYSIVTETAKGDDLAYAQALVVKHDAVSRLVFSPESHPLADVIRTAYVSALNEHDTTDISSWLIRVVVAHCGGVALRRDGGVYYVPPIKMPAWLAACAAVESCTGHKIDRIPALSSKDTLRAVLNAIEAEAAKEAELMLEELSNKNTGKGISDRLGKARLTRCDEVEAKVSMYEELLGAKLDSLREKLGELRTSLSTAMLAAAADAE